MSEQIVRVDDFEAALRRLRAMQDKLPDQFEFDIPSGYFSNLSFAEAIPRQRMMREFERFCYGAGYKIEHRSVTVVWDTFWRYTLKRSAKALPEKSKDADVINV